MARKTARGTRYRSRKKAGASTYRRRSYSGRRRASGTGRSRNAAQTLRIVVEQQSSPLDPVAALTEQVTGPTKKARSRF